MKNRELLAAVAIAANSLGIPPMRLPSFTAGINKYTPHQSKREKMRRRIGGFHVLRWHEKTGIPVSDRITQELRCAYYFSPGFDHE